MNRSAKIKKTASAIAEITKLKEGAKMIKAKIAFDSDNLNDYREKLEYTQNNLKQSEIELHALSDELGRLERKNETIKLWIAIASWVVFVEACVIVTLLLVK